MYFQHDLYVESLDDPLKRANHICHTVSDLVINCAPEHEVSFACGTTSRQKMVGQWLKKERLIRQLNDSNLKKKHIKEV